MSFAKRPRQKIVAITGRRADSPRYSDYIASMAFEVGKMCSEKGLIILTGGLSGVMEAAAHGAKSVSGKTVGILPGLQHQDANPYIDIVLPSGLGILRNSLIASGCDLMVALPGGTGTLEEICFALDFGKPVLSIEGWSIPAVDFIEKYDRDLIAIKIDQMIGLQK